MPQLSPTLTLILAVVILAVLFAGLRYAIWWNRYRSVKKLLSTAFSPLQAATYLDDFHSLSYSLTVNGEEAVEPILRFFLREGLKPDYFAYRAFMVLGEGGAGKTHFLVYLLTKYHLKWNKPYKIAFHACHEAALLPKLREYDNPEETILILDGLDEDGRSMTDFRKRIDEILTATSSFAKIIISCNQWYLSQFVNFSDQEEYVRLEGLNSSELFLTLFLLPFSQNQQLKLYKQTHKSLSSKGQLRLKGILSQAAELFEKPILWRYSNLLVEEEGTLRAESQAWGRVIDRWVSHNSIGLPSEKVREQEGIQELLINLAHDMFTQVERRGGFFIPEAQFYALLQKHGITPRKLSQEVLTHDPDGHIIFSHKNLLAYLLAKGVYQEKVPDLSLSSVRLPELRKFWLERVWHLTQTGFHEEEKEWGMYIGPFSDAKKPLWEVEASDLQQLTHLFLKKFRSVDMRFLKACTKLECLYLKDANLSDLHHLFLPFLPAHPVKIFIPSDELEAKGNWKVFFKDPADPLRFIEDKPAQRKDPFIPFSYTHPRPDREVVVSAEALFTLLSWELPDISEEKLTATHLDSFADEHAPKVYEGHLEKHLAGIFDKIKAMVFPGGSMNIVFYSSFSSALLNEDLKHFLKILSDVYGRDEQGSTYLTQTDKVQLEEGWWQGRCWKKDLPAHIGIPINLYMDSPGKLSLVLFGLPEMEKREEEDPTEEDEALAMG
ncbi:MAG: hypothetical protein AAFR66_10140 [Bacteroidota bacterium]